MLSNDSALWCWDAATQGACDDSPSQCQDWRGVLSCSVEDRACQGMVTLPRKSLRGVRALRRAPLFEVLVANTLRFIILSMFCRNLHKVGVKTTGSLLVHPWKTFVMLLDLSWARHIRILSLEPFPLFLRVLHTFRWRPSILILYAEFPCHKISKLFHRLIPPSNLSHVRNDLILDDPFYLPL